MAILGDIGSVLGGAAHDVGNVVGDAAQAVTGQTPGQLVGGAAHALGAVGNTLTQNLGSTGVNVAINPNGQTAITKRLPTRQGMFTNMLLGALGGLSSMAAPGRGGNALVGPGEAMARSVVGGAQMVQQRQQQQLAQQDALQNQQLHNELASLKAQDAHKATAAQIALSVANQLRYHAEARAAGAQATKLETENDIAISAWHTHEGDQNLGSVGAGPHEEEQFQQRLAQHPLWAQWLAQGRMTTTVNPDGGLTFWYTKGDLSSPTTAPLSVAVGVDSKGNLTYKTFPGGSITRRQSLSLIAGSQKLISEYAPRMTAARANAAAAATRNKIAQQRNANENAANQKKIRVNALRVLLDNATRTLDSVIHSQSYITGDKTVVTQAQKLRHQIATIQGQLNVLGAPVVTSAPPAAAAAASNSAPPITPQGAPALPATAVPPALMERAKNNQIPVGAVFTNKVTHTRLRYNGNGIFTALPPLQ
jgi:hypothetical protein